MIDKDERWIHGECKLIGMSAAEKFKGLWPCRFAEVPSIGSGVKTIDRSKHSKVLHVRSIIHTSYTVGGVGNEREIPYIIVGLDI